MCVLTGESKEPSYYQLKNNETTACLATDFSSFNSTKVDTSIFNNEATRMKEDPYYSQVALNKKCPYNSKCLHWFIAIAAAILDIEVETENIPTSTFLIKLLSICIDR